MKRRGKKERNQARRKGSQPVSEVKGTRRSRKTKSEKSEEKPPKKQKDR